VQQTGNHWNGLGGGLWHPSKSLEEEFKVTRDRSGTVQGLSQGCIEKTVNNHSFAKENEKHIV